MAGIPAPKKISNFPFTGRLTANMTFLVADPDTQQNWQVSPELIVQFVSSQILPLAENKLSVFSSLFSANITVDASFAGQTLVFEGNTDVTFSFAQSTPDNWRLTVINLSNTANVNFDYSGLPTVGTPTVLSKGLAEFIKVGGSIVGA
jgi:hypothetical protein